MGRSWLYGGKRLRNPLNAGRNPIKAKWSKHIWHPDTPPKINIFSWILLQGKILTCENLNKRGISGPSRCVLCKNHTETIAHLFLDCDFSKKFWQGILQNLSHRVNWPGEISDLLGNWISYYKKSFFNKPILKRIWSSLPKFVCWQVWLAQNKSIFLEEVPDPKKPSKP
jgi:hypothetical protein